MINDKTPMVVKTGALSMQVCVPVNWDNKQVIIFAEGENPCGTEQGWQIRKGGDKLLDDAPERAQCGERSRFVHIMLDA